MINRIRQLLTGRRVPTKSISRLIAEPLAQESHSDPLAEFVLSAARDRRSPRPSYPNTFDPARPDVVDRAAAQPRVFEPAFAYFGNGFRWGEPSFTDDDLKEAWQRARRRVLFHLLRTTAESAWGKRVILRGSVLLQAWLGDAAREPGDLDWVVDPPALNINDPQAVEMLAGLIRAGCAAGEQVGILPDQIRIEEIWTYGRAPGRRIIFPWKVADLPQGTIQMDFVFNETFPSETIRVPIAGEDGATSIIEAASPEQSLAWKLMWLHTDRSPQGKDLYDAVLLAEFKALPLDLLENTLATADADPLHRDPFLLDSPLRWDVDWENFKLEYPSVPGNVDSWKTRLVTALRPTFNAT